MPNSIKDKKKKKLETSKYNYRMMERMIWKEKRANKNILKDAENRQQIKKYFFKCIYLGFDTIWDMETRYVEYFRAKSRGDEADDDRWAISSDKHEKNISAQTFAVVTRIWWEQTMVEGLDQTTSVPDFRLNNLMLLMMYNAWVRF